MAMTNQPKASAPAEKAIKPKSAFETIKNWDNEIKEYAPAWTGTGYAELFMKDLLEAVKKSDSLQKAYFKDKAAFRGAVKDIASVGLRIGGPRPEAHIVPVKGKAEAWPNYHGLIKLAERNPKIKHIYSSVVYESDTFIDVRGTTPKIDHSVTYSKIPQRTDDKIIAAYAVIFWADGESPKPAVVYGDELAQKRDNALSKMREKWQKEQSPWHQHFARMCEKTAIHRVLREVTLDDVFNKALDMQEKHQEINDKATILEGEYKETQSDEALINILEGCDD